MFDVLDREPPAREQPPAREVVPSLVDALVDPDRAAAELATLTPSADVVAALAVLGPEVLTQAGRIDALTVIDRQLAWLTALQQSMIVALADDAAAREAGRAAATPRSRGTPRVTGGSPNRSPAPYISRRSPRSTASGSPGPCPGR